MSSSLGRRKLSQSKLEGSRSRLSTVVPSSENTNIEPKTPLITQQLSASGRGISSVAWRRGGERRLAVARSTELSFRSWTVTVSHSRELSDVPHAIQWRRLQEALSSGLDIRLSLQLNTCRLRLVPHIFRARSSLESAVESG